MVSHYDCFKLSKPSATRSSTIDDQTDWRKRSQWKIEKDENTGREKRRTVERKNVTDVDDDDEEETAEESRWKGKERKGSCNLSSRSRHPSWGWLSETLTTVLFEDIVVDRRDTPLDISILENCAANRMLRVRVARASWSGRSSRRYIYTRMSILCSRGRTHTHVHSLPPETTCTVSYKPHWTLANFKYKLRSIGFITKFWRLSFEILISSIEIKNMFFLLLL